MNLTIWMKSLLNFLYPNRCPVCDSFLDAHTLVCEDCGNTILLGQDDYCHRCGKIACRCKYMDYAFDRAVVCCRYDESTIPAVLALKKSRNTNFAYFTAQIIAERLRNNPLYGDLDYVTAVPMHPSKERQRGYNQAALIGEEIARLLAIPYYDDILYKAYASPAQHTLGREARRKNVDAFRIRSERLDGLRILLCDDVLTTGSTLHRCAALLKENGAKTVIAAAAATTIPKKQEEQE